MSCSFFCAFVFFSEMLSSSLPMLENEGSVNGQCEDRNRRIKPVQTRCFFGVCMRVVWGFDNL